MSFVWEVVPNPYRIVADYMPPRIQDRPIDLIAVKDDHEIVYAICLDTVITLAAVKSLGSFEATHKAILTTGLLMKKVQESRFFSSRKSNTFTCNRSINLFEGMVSENCH